jgi:hypothetical protein
MRSLSRASSTPTQDLLFTHTINEEAKVIHDMHQPLLRPAAKLSWTEWSYHRLHAILGAYCLGHFLYRFQRFFVEGSASMGLDLLTAREMMALFAAHLALQWSGFAFAIPPKRFRDGFRIWPQYRFEALIFTCRSLGLIVLAWHRGREFEKGSTKNSSVWVPTLFVLSASAAADLVGKFYERTDQRSNTLRDVNMAPIGIIYLAAAAQFHANVHILMMTDQYCVQFAALMIVQVTAFFMTLRRKGAINVPFGIVLYGLVLLLGMATIAKDLLDRGCFGIGFTLGNATALLRFEVSVNKYVIWISTAMILEYLYAKFNGLSDDALGGTRRGNIAAAISFGLFLVAATRKQLSTTKQKQSHQRQKEYPIALSSCKKRQRLARMEQ